METALERAFALPQKGRHDEALPLLAAALSLNPDSDLALRNHGNALATRGATAPMRCAGWKKRWPMSAARWRWTAPTPRH